VLLAVIFRCENAPDSQTGNGAGISQNIRAVFSRISAILGVGNPSGEDSLRRRSGAGKRAGSLPVLWGILDPHNRPFSRFYPAPARKTGVLQAKRVCQGHFSGSKTSHFLLKTLIIRDFKKMSCKFAIFRDLL